MCRLDEQSALRTENTELRTLRKQTQAQLAAALTRIAELEQERRDPPLFVKPNHPKPLHTKLRKKMGGGAQSWT